MVSDKFVIICSNGQVQDLELSLPPSSEKKSPDLTRSGSHWSRIGPGLSVGACIADVDKARSVMRPLSTADP